ncbi:MAG: hypothetical protein DCF32_19010 [Leptolyngbya sp.]|nr:MAG: hypothetical protein DCF32_19010 [Leptolyngbya sp.]
MKPKLLRLYPGISGIVPRLGRRAIDGSDAVGQAVIVHTAIALHRGTWPVDSAEGDGSVAGQLPRE